ncbi:hypothetical protein Hanom_Chr02g00125231 [Helianthus anomalus]
MFFDVFGSLDGRAGIYVQLYDIRGSRLIIFALDKTINTWKEDENTTPETNLVNFKPPTDIGRDESMLPQWWVLVYYQEIEKEHICDFKLFFDGELFQQGKISRETLEISSMTAKFSSKRTFRLLA